MRKKTQNLEVELMTAQNIYSISLNKNSNVLFSPSIISIESHKITNESLFYSNTQIHHNQSELPEDLKPKRDSYDNCYTNSNQSTNYEIKSINNIDNVLSIKKSSYNLRQNYYEKLFQKGYMLLSELWKAEDLQSYQQKYPKETNQLLKEYNITLQSDKIIRNQNKRKHNSIIILDWDNTLFPSTYLENCMFNNINILADASIMYQMKRLENKIGELLITALSKGDVYIITNEEEGCIEELSENYFPKINPLMMKVNIVSAKKENEHNYPGNNRKWKYYSFENIVNRYDLSRLTNIICVGNSLFDAKRNYCKSFNEILIKCFKFSTIILSIYQLVNEISKVVNQFNFLHDTTKIDVIETKSSK